MTEEIKTFIRLVIRERELQAQIAREGRFVKQDLKDRLSAVTKQVNNRLPHIQTLLKDETKSEVE